MTNVKYFQLFIAINVSWMQLFIAVWTHKCSRDPEVFLHSKLSKWSDVWPSMVTHTRNLCSAFNPSKVHTHSSEHTHTPWTHTRSSGQPFMLRRPGSSWGSGALFKGTSVVVLKEERALYIQSPHLQFLLDLRLEPSGYKSDSLTIRPRLPFNSNWSMFVWFEIKT